jgi:hypothetical protein
MRTLCAREKRPGGPIGELQESSVVALNAITASDGKAYETKIILSNPEPIEIIFLSSRIP